MDKPMNPYGYLIVRDYAEHPELYVRSFKMIQADVQKLFEYVEPADKNIETYSMQIYNLFFRICVEVEANFKAILRENTYHGTGEWWNMGDYRKVNKTHHLSGYKVTFPVWNGEKRTFAPFADWATDDPEAKLEWYDIYNSCKHNKYQYMEQATLGTKLQEFYSTVVYEHRNKCAHNLLSLQKNLPTLKTLEEEEFMYNNYYFRFSVLVLLDEIFVRLFKAYLGAMARYKVART